MKNHQAAPFFSIIIPTLNERKFLPHLLDSLVGQHEQFEVIVVDADSADGTADVARSYSKKMSIRVLVSSKGVSRQRNIGAAAARGTWLVFMDADSVLFSNFFARARQYIAYKKSKLFTTWFSPDSAISGDALVTILANMFVEGSILFHRAVAPGPLIVIDKELFNHSGGFNETLTFGEDYDLTQRLEAMGAPLTVLRETLYIYSLRRIRKEGKLKVFHAYAMSSLLVLLTKKNFHHMPGYVTGGQLYNKKTDDSVFASFQRRLNTIVREIFG